MKETRMNEIAAAFGTDEEKIKEIAGKSLDEALEYFRSNGYDFTKDELTEFAKTIEEMSKSGELSEKELEGAAGGCAFTLACIAGALALANMGIFAATDSYNFASRNRYGGSR